MKLQKVTSLLMAGIMFSTSFAMPTTATNVSDMPTEWSKEAVTIAIEEGLLTDTNGLIRPMEMLTRAEMAEGMVNAFGATVLAEMSAYTDISSDKVYYEDISKAVAMGILTGYGDGKLKPELYRRFKIKENYSQDDISCTYEILKRRLKRKEKKSTVIKVK